MKGPWPVKSIPALTGGIAIAVLVVWLSRGPALTMTTRLPGADGVPAGLRPATAPAAVDLATLVTLSAEAFKAERSAGPGKPAELPGSWPAFRGPSRDGISREDTPLAESWPPGGPPVLWRVDTGQGHAGPAIHAGRIYLLDYDEKNQRDALRCMSLADGKEIWRYSYPAKIAYDHGMSRTVPAVGDGFVLTLGPLGHVMCIDANSGRFRWGLDLVKQLGTEIPRWYAGQCPLIDNGLAIIAPGSPAALMIAVDCDTGKIVWATPNPDGWKMTHSSIAVMTFAGRKMYLYCGSDGVAGISADDGKVLWRTDEWKIRIATVPTPVPLGGGKILLTGGYNAGAMLIRLTETDGKLAVKVIRRLRAKVFGVEQQTPIFHDGYVYAVRANGELACLDTSGTIKWTSGKGDRYGKGKGPLLLAGGRLYVMDEKATLTLVAASPDGYKRLARANVIEKGHYSWAPMAIAGGRLILRDITRMVCLDVRARP